MVCPFECIQITLSDDERDKLKLLSSRPKTSQRDALRASIILACDEEWDGVFSKTFPHRSCL